MSTNYYLKNQNMVEYSLLTNMVWHGSVTGNYVIVFWIYWLAKWQLRNITCEKQINLIIVNCI